MPRDLQRPLNNSIAEVIEKDSKQHDRMNNMNEIKHSFIIKYNFDKYCIIVSVNPSKKRRTSSE
jgi:hypothetical protein